MKPTEDQVFVPLYRLAHSRTGDKGNISNISVIAYAQANYPLIRDQLTAAAVKQWFAFREPACVQRYEIASIGALNFVLHEILDGGVNSALNLDTHGKSLSFHLLDFPISISPTLAQTLPDVPD